MANTITNTIVVKGDDLVVIQLLLASDGSEETDLVVYDSSAVATLLGNPDSLSSTILGIQLVVQNSANAANMTLKYHATTSVIALPMSFGPDSGAFHEAMNFSDHGGIINLAKGTAGATGDITLTTTGLDSGDVFLMFLHIKPY